MAKAVKGEKMFAVKRALIEELLQNPEWVKRLEEAKSFREVERVLRRFARAKRLKVKEVMLHG